MAFDELISLLVNNGVGVACIAYFMFRDYKFMQKLSDLLSALNVTLDTMRGVNEDDENV